MPTQQIQFVRTLGGIDEYQLPQNGLRILLVPDPLSPVATFMMTYEVGARHEQTGKTGLAHLLEHMLFKGTKRYDWRKGTSSTALFSRLGAIHNASTNVDATNYYATVPREYLDLIIDIEADRMRNTIFEPIEFAREREVVINELKYYENSPYMSLSKAMWHTAFQNHAYRVPVIGKIEDLRALEVEDLKTFYDKHYWPHRATAIVSGGFEKTHILKVIEEKFGAIPKGPLDPMNHPAEPEQMEPHQTTVFRRDPVNVVAIGHKAPKGTDADTLKLNLLSQILSGGTSSRLYRKLIDTQLAVQVYTLTYDYHDPNLIVTYAALAQGVDHENVQQIILNEYQNIIENGITEEELARVRSQWITAYAYARDGSSELASALHEEISKGDWSLFVTSPEIMAQITPEDIQKAAQTYLVSNHQTSAWLQSKTDAELGVDPTQPAAPPAHGAEANINLENQWTDLHLPPVSEPTLAKNAQKFNFQGIKLICLKTHIQNVISLTGSFENKNLKDPQNAVKTDLTALLLGKGTKKHTKYELSDRLETRGIQLSFEADNGRVSFRGKTLKADLPILLETIAEILSETVFDPTELDAAKKNLEFKLQNDSTNTREIAFSAMSRMIYPKNHPQYKIPIEQQLGELRSVSLEDIQSFYAQSFKPEQFTIVAVGDLTKEKFKEELTRAFHGLKSEKKVGSNTSSFKSPAAKKEIVYLPDKDNVDTVVAHALDMKRTDPDYLPLNVGISILGGDMTARLSHQIREIRGLSYTVYAALKDMDDENTGLWMAHMITNAQNVTKALPVLFEEIEAMANKGATEEELRNKKLNLTGRYLSSLSKTSTLANYILLTEEMGLGYSYLDEYPRLIDSLTLEQVNKKLQQYLSKDRLNLVVVGNVQAEALDSTLLEIHK